MTKKRLSLKDAFTMAGVLTLVLIALPVAAILGVFARLPLLVAVAVALGIGAVLAAFSPTFRDWLSAEVDQELTYNGLRLAAGTAVSPYHSWARVAAKETRVGADDLVQAVLGPIDRVELPVAGYHVEVGDPLFRLRHGHRAVTVRSPVSGDVVGTNQALREEPRLVNNEPFGSGWAVRLRTDRPKDGRRLFRGKGARAWFRLEVDRLLASVSPGVATLPDGGVISQRLHEQIDDDTWERLSRSFFGPKDMPWGTEA
jgi:glycine cleavage system H protein